MHYARMRKHGSTDDPRPERYGLKKEHPLWQRWAQLKKRDLLVSEWREDFWAFVEGVSPQPEDAKKLARADESKPFGPGNFFWMKTPTRDENLAYFKAWREKNPDYHRALRYGKLYDLTPAEYEEMLAEQGGCCSICGSAGNIKNNQGDQKRLAVDHDHETGAVRDLLCDHCNRGLGCFEDNPGLLTEALAYLLRHKPTRKLNSYPRERKGVG